MNSDKFNALQVKTLGWNGQLPMLDLYFLIKRLTENGPGLQLSQASNLHSVTIVYAMKFIALGSQSPLLLSRLACAKIQLLVMLLSAIEVVLVSKSCCPFSIMQTILLQRQHELAQAC